MKRTLVSILAACLVAAVFSPGAFAQKRLTILHFNDTHIPTCLEAFPGH